MRVVIYGRHMCSGCDEVRQLAVAGGHAVEWEDMEAYLLSAEAHYGEMSEAGQTIVCAVRAKLDLEDGALPIVWIDGHVYGYQGAKEVLG